MADATLDYEPPRRRPPSIGRLHAAVFIVVCMLVLVSVLLPSLNTVRDGDPSLRCMSNLRQIGTAFALYANEYQQATASDFVSLLEKEDLVSEVFICESTSDERSAATQPTVLRADFAAGGHCSYVYVGFDGRFDALTKNDVLAYEPPHHDPTWAYVLFADGSVERINVSRLSMALDNRVSGKPVSIDRSRE